MRECPHPKPRVWRRYNEGTIGVGYTKVTIWVCDRCGESWETSKWVPPRYTPYSA